MLPKRNLVPPSLVEGRLSSVENKRAIKIQYLAAEENHKKLVIRSLIFSVKFFWVQYV
jgi:hypothetical protein